MIDRGWVAQAVRDAMASAPLSDGAREVERLKVLLAAAAEGFASARADVLLPTVTWPRRGIVADEAATFLAAVAEGHVVVDPAGYFTMPGVRPKVPAGRYSLLSKNGSGTSVNLEYVIQAGATSELTRLHGWPQDQLDFERGKFDALAHDGPTEGRVVLAMEAKCRVTGPDSLEKLLTSWLAVDATYGPPADNAGRKYAELVRLCAPGPVVLWLVAADARWTFLASVRVTTLDLVPFPDPGREGVLAATRV